MPASFLFWSHQIFIVLAATGYTLGITQSREYACAQTTMPLVFLLIDPASGEARHCETLFMGPEK